LGDVIGVASDNTDLGGFVVCGAVVHWNGQICALPFDVELAFQVGETGRPVD